MKPLTYLPIFLIILAFAILFLFSNQASASTGADYHREQAIMALGYVQDPRAYLYWKSAQEGLSKVEIQRLDQIAMCESRWNTGAQNSTSSAAGVFQIIQGTWKANSSHSWNERYHYKANIDTAIIIYQQRGFQPWSCNKMI